MSPEAALIPDTAISVLISRAQIVARIVAQALSDCEQHGDEPPIPSHIVEAALQSTEAGSFEWLDLERAARVIALSWDRAVQPGRLRRPDVLAVTCDILSNPERVDTMRVVRFAVVLALRSLYGLPFSIETVQRLRETYDDLTLRFRHQQRRRIRKRPEAEERFLIDLLALEGYVYRSLDASNRVPFYARFSQQRFAVSEDDLFEGPSGPELHGSGASLPSFPSILNLAFGQPLCIPGLDEIIGGLLPALPATSDATLSGGQVTLVAGPPGSGKTSLCLSIASRMAELGANVRYVSTEEDSGALDLKRGMVQARGYLARSLLLENDHPLREQFDVLSIPELDSFEEFVEALETELGPQRRHKRDSGSDGLPVYLVFSWVVVIDSLTVLVGATEAGRGERRHLGELLRRLRRLGVCVFLVGGEDDCRDHGLAYLVDNVFVLTTEAVGSDPYRLRGLTVEKTRLQTSHRGRHVFHLSRHHGCEVSPSLHTVIRELHDRSQVPTDPAQRALIFPATQERIGDPRQVELPMVSALYDDVPERREISIQRSSQVLVYGHGSASKARFALALALTPRLPVLPDNFASGAEVRPRHIRRPRMSVSRRRIPQRVLVLSFLYSADYYEEIIRDWRRSRKESVGTTIKVLDWYPGYIDPETILARVREEVTAARLLGQPYTSVVIDGLHNAVLQYPLVERERLFWAAISRVLRVEGLDVVATFTFFEIARTSKGRNPAEPAVDVSWTLLFHLLVSGMDYSFVVERDEKTPRGIVSVRVASSIDGADSGIYQWNTQRFAPA